MTPWTAMDPVISEPAAIQSSRVHCPLPVVTEDGTTKPGKWAVAQMQVIDLKERGKNRKIACV